MPGGVARVPSSQFEVAQKSPRYAELMAFTPDLSGRNVGPIIFLVFLAGFAGVGFVMTVFFLMLGPLALVPFSISMLAVYGFFRSLGAPRRFNAAPTERVLAVVRDETVETGIVTEANHDDRQGHHYDRTTRRVQHDHCVVLELKSGDRQSHEVSAELARLVVKGDVGVAYLKGGVLLDFKPLPKS